MPITLITHYLPQLPDADIEVIVFFATGSSTPGAWNGERWIDHTGMPLDQGDPSERNKVIAWAEFPASTAESMPGDTMAAKVAELQLALDMLAGLAGEVSTSDPITVAQRVFDHVQAELLARAEEIKRCQDNLAAHRDIINKLRASPGTGYSIDADPLGIRARTVDAIRGAMAFGAAGERPAPDGHWLGEFWRLAFEGL